MKRLLALAGIAGAALLPSLWVAARAILAAPEGVTFLLLVALSGLVFVSGGLFLIGLAMIRVLTE